MELLIALAVTGLIGAVIASMLTAVSHGTDTSRDLRDVVVKGKTLSERITQAVRTADRVIEYGENYIELQVSEDDGGSYDVLRIEHNETENTLIRRFRPASATTWQEQIWARDVTAWSITFDPINPAEAKLLSFRLTLKAGKFEQVVIGAASLRN